ncbi:chemotaxis protein [Paramagnetospirillum marisnigri]|uniref:Chemotaxis protein n=1 Tax=Paramagnetospirillum marisnigri TaxID=1285242 RepID=A0A178MTW5_9PROT|nr:chemotaxis protein CheW [Paramagnetospirillum marisnigri]OAN53710.1 chemotaxis protein [Paramagnetospirillum marisnigri]
MSGQNVASLSGIITFRLCEQVFGVPVHSVREVVPLAWLDRPPQLPSLVHGVLNLGGRAVAVLRLDRLLGLGDGRYDLDASILIMRDDGAGRGLGLLVEHVDGVRSAELFSPMGDAGQDSFNGCVSEHLDLQGQAVRLLSWDRLLLEEERRRLTEFQAQAQDRLALLDEAAS